MSDTINVDQEWKEEAKESKDKMASDERQGQSYVSCAEVALYLTELTKVLEQITGGIRSSLEEMLKRAADSKEAALEGEDNDGE
mgnify:CR=1 FL=1